MRLLLLTVLVLFVVPVFFVLAGPPVPVGNEQATSSGLTVGFDPAVCARLPAPESRLCDYGNLFNQAGQQSRLDPRLLAAVAYAESGYAADVVDCRRASEDGALGLMQFMPGTAEERGVDPCDASSAILGAAKYLRDLYRELGPVAEASNDTSEEHRWELAVAGYNAGPNGVRAAGGIPRNGETEVYVPRVMAKWEQYKGLFPGTGGVGGCPVAAPSGSTDPIETDHHRITPATQAMANAVISCFGRGPHPIYCFDQRLGNGSKYEHPRGRACDFMITGGSRAVGDAQARGQAMAEWLVDHADELNILYVVWYDRVWNSQHDADGVDWAQWRDYDGCKSPCTNPSTGHYNHVHVSIALQPGDPPWAECVPGISCRER